MSEFLIGIGIFLMIAFVWAFVLLGGIKRLSRPRTTSGIWLMFGILILVGVAFLAAGALVEYHDSPEFCGELCHPMKPYMASYLNPQNNTVMRTHLEHNITCMQCHTGPGLRGQVKPVLVDGPKELFSLVTQTYDPDNIHGYVPSANCMKGCHDDLDWLITAPAERGADFTVQQGHYTIWPTVQIWHPLTQNGTDFSELEALDTCVDCHDQRMSGTGYTRYACPICHDITDEELDIHRDQTCGMEDCHSDPEYVGHKEMMDNCMFCHDRLHPQDARVPYVIAQQHGIYEVNSTFCSACHSESYETFIHQESKHGSHTGCPDCHDQHKFHPDCLDCHDEDGHAVQHDTTGWYGECQSCHYLGGHAPFEISFDTGKTTTNAFCGSQCHADAASRFATGQHSDLYCIVCHNKHGELVIDFTECSQCHDYPTNHETITSGCLNCHDTSVIHTDVSLIPLHPGDTPCATCHFDQGEKLESGEHSFIDCQTCHGTHELVEVDFASCTCHSPPSSHDETLRTCSSSSASCHDLTAIHTLPLP